MKKIIFTFASAFLLFLSCKKEDGASPMVNPITAYVKAEGWTKTPYNAVAYDLGYSFSTLKDGKITKLGVNMPEPGSYTVSLYDFDTKALLRQVKVSQTGTEAAAYADIESLAIIKDKKYVVSLNTVADGVTKKYYGFEPKVKPTSTIFPITSNTVVIQNIYYNSGNIPKMPVTIYNSLNSLFGIPDFTFQAN
jgi:hypothetical protein